MDRKKPGTRKTKLSTVYNTLDEFHSIFDPNLRSPGGPPQLLDTIEFCALRYVYVDSGNSITNMLLQKPFLKKERLLNYL